MDLTEKEKARIVAKHRRRIQAECNAAGRRSDPAFAAREAEYLKAHPHLAKHKHCGLIETTEETGRLIKLPNGLKLRLNWYKPDEFTAAGKVAGYKPAKWEAKAFKQREAVYRLELNERRNGA